MSITPTNTTTIDPSLAPATPWEVVLDSHGGDVGRALSAIFAGRPGGDVRPGDGVTLEIWRAPVGAGAITRTLDPWDGAAPGSEGYDGANPLAPWILTDGSEHDGAIASPFGGRVGPIRDPSWVADVDGGTVVVTVGEPKVVSREPAGTGAGKDGGAGGDTDGGTGGCADGGTGGPADGGTPDAGGAPASDAPKDFKKDPSLNVIKYEPHIPGGSGSTGGVTKMTTGEDGGPIAARDLLGMLNGLLSSGVAFAGGVDAGLTERLLGGKSATADAFVFGLSGGGGVDALAAGFDGLAGFAGTAALKQALVEASARGDIDGVAVLAVADGDGVSWAAVDFDDWL